MPVAVRGRQDFAVVADLNREWAQLSRHPVPNWWRLQAPLARCQTLGDALDAIPEAADLVLGALLAVVQDAAVRDQSWVGDGLDQNDPEPGLIGSRGDSQLAGRVVLQAMLGKLVLLSRRGPEQLGIESFLWAMWECICSYPLQRRPRHVAANLVLDTRKRAHQGAITSPVAVPYPPGEAFAQLIEHHRWRVAGNYGGDFSTLTAGEVIAAAVELELIDRSAGKLLDLVYRDGLSSKEVAKRQGLSAPTVRRRCSRAVQRLTECAPDLMSTAADRFAVNPLT